MKKASKKPVTIPAKKRVGKQIRAARERLGLTQEEMAEIFDVDVMTVSRWERDVFLPQSPPAILMALEHLQFQRLLDGNELLRSVERRRAELDALSELLDREREEFDKSMRVKQ